jgi:hypothetical protein
VPRNLLQISPEMRVGLEELHRDQAERNRWRGPLLVSAP